MLAKGSMNFASAPGRRQRSTRPSGHRGWSTAQRAWLERRRLAGLLTNPLGLHLGIATVAIAIGFWAAHLHPWIPAWIAALALTASARWRLLYSWRRNPRRHTVSGWRGRYGLTLHTEGWLWAMLAGPFFPAPTSHPAIAVGLLLTALPVTGLLLYSSSLWMFAAFSAPILVAATLRSLAVVEMDSTWISLFWPGFFLLLFGIAAHLRRGTLDSLELEYENRLLLDEFERTNRDLLARTRSQEAARQELLRRDAILQAVRFAAEHLLDSRTWEEDPVEILEQLGLADGVQRVQLLHYHQASGALRVENRYVWTTETTSTLDAPLELPVHEADRSGVDPVLITAWRSTLEAEQPVFIGRSGTEGLALRLLEAHGTKSLAAIPVTVRGELWGTLVFEDLAAERTWVETERSALLAAANMLGAAVQGMRTEEALRHSDDRYRLLAENTSDLVALHKPDASYLYVSPSSQTLLGFESFELMQFDPLALVLDAEREEVRQRLLTAARTDDTDPLTYRMRHSDGRLIWVETRVRAVRDGLGQMTLFVTSSRDVTERRRADEQLYREKELAQVTLSSIGDGVITTDGQGVIQYMNPAARRLTGRRGQIDGLEVRRLFGDRGESAAFARLVDRALDSPEIVSPENPLVLTAPDDAEIAIKVTAARLRDRHRQTIGTVTVLHDVTDNRRLAEQLTYHATRDPLTDLLNRREFENRLHHSVRTRLDGEGDALCYLDLDQFKVVNDTCGHAAGDELLRQLAGILRTHVRQTDVVARLGGDEFGLLLTECPAERAESVAQGICEAVRAFRFTWQDKAFRLGASIGVVPITQGVSSVTELLSAADTACYAAKDSGRNRVHMFTAGDSAIAKRTGDMEWVSRVHGALENDLFELWYQPIFDAQPAPLQNPESFTLRLHETIAPRVEILLRMKGEDGETILPGSFIPAAERYNTMPAVDRWVVARTLGAFAPRWHAGSRGALDCFINLSGPTLTDPSFGDFVKEQIEQHRVPTGRLCFEITETAAITNLREARKLIRELQELGCRFALDDFGSGLSSFAYLRSLPVDFLKIDGLFVKDIDRDEIDYSIVESIHRVGRGLGLKTIAEFVESDAIRDRLMGLGVDCLQGYGLAKPRPLGDLFSPPPADDILYGPTAGQA